jgi:molecular chaperone DnaK
MMSDSIMGIDLGTTNSEVAIIENGQPAVISDADGLQIIPSVVGISPTGEVLVGIEARNQYIVAPERTVRSIKRKMGTKERVKMAGQKHSPQEISAFILRKLKEIAERKVGKIQQAVITVPAYFSDAQRQATKDAGEIAGLDVARIINEPTAAALAYGIDKEEDQFILVYDLGGGTFDVSVIELNSGIVEVRASHGNTQLGGDDFDERIVNYVVGQFKSEHDVDLRKDRQAMARLTRAAEIAKIELSDQPFATIREEFIATKRKETLNLEMEISRSRFEAMIRDLIMPTLDAMKTALDEAGLTAKDINKVLMVGGSTRIPLVMQMVEDWLGKQPRSEMNPELCVAMGAAVQGGIIAGEAIDTILVDVSPHSLGIAVASIMAGMLVPDRFSTLIRRNSTIPVSKSEVYTTLFDKQEAVEVKVYQGENLTASENTLLGTFKLSVPPAPAGEPKIVVAFDYDVNGIVHVSASDRKTGKENKITVAATPDRLTEEEKSEAIERTEAVWSHPERGRQLTALMAEADRLIRESKGKDAKKLATAVQKLREAVEKDKDNEEISRLEDEVLDEMYELEP